MSDFPVKRAHLAKACAKEIVEAGEYFRSHEEQATAQRWADQTTQLIRLITQSPMSGAPVPGTSVYCRRWRIGKFRYHLYSMYYVQSGLVLIFWLRPGGQKELATPADISKELGQRKGDVITLTGDDK